jgi:microcystin-dependent protein
MKIKYLLFLLFCLIAKSSYAQVDPYIGEIRIFASNFAPQGWLKCEGQLIPIQQNVALFSILGTTYGGNGTTTFALPDLRQKVAVGFGQSPGLSQYALGQTGGQESVTLTANNIPAHNHSAPIKVSSANATTSTPTTASSLAVAKQVVNTLDRTVLKYDTTTTNTAIGTMKTSTTGSANPTAINTVQPVTASLYCIAAQGIFPPRN